MVRKVWIGIIIAIIIGLVAAVWIRQSPKPVEPNIKTSNLEIGVILPLTGGAASLGKASLSGMQLAIEEYNSAKTAGGPTVDLAVEDDQAQPAKAVAAFQKLIVTPGVQLVLGPLTSGSTLAVAPLAGKNHVVILSPGGSAPAITNAGNYVFRNELSEAYGARAQAELAFSRLGFKSVALLYVNNEYGVGTVSVFRKRFEELSGRIVADEGFNAGATDLRSALAKIKAAKPGAIFVVFQDEIVNILKQRIELGISASVYTTPVFEDPANLKTLGPLAEGVIYTYYGSFSPDAQTGATADFVAAYKKRFGNAPTYYAALGYDAARIEIAALQSAQFDLEKVKDSMYRIRNFPGVTGETSFDHNGDVTKPVSLKIVQGGRFVAH